LQSTISGPQEGTYFIHPNHFKVWLPRDCNDDEIGLDEKARPIAGLQPTAMTYFLARVRLAQICREITDTTPLETSKLMEMPYESIVALDKKLRDFLQSLPFFFQLDSESRQRSRPIETIYHNIPAMRYCIMIAAHSRRCRLHHRFLLRQSSKPRHSFSRQACLESAGIIVQLYEEPQGLDGSSIPTAYLGKIVHYTHLALVVMVMDLCSNKDISGQEMREVEVGKVLRMLEGVRDVSPILGRSLDSLNEILVKHNIHLVESPGSTTNSLAERIPVAKSTHIHHNDHVQAQFGAFDFDFQGLGDMDINFDEFWQVSTHEDGLIDPNTWDDIFSTLDSQPF
jgi:hypothetical protein